MNKRQFLKKSFFGLASVGLLGGVYSWQIEPFWLEFVHQKMPIKNLPKNLIGKTLMQISDIHIGKRFDYTYVIKSFEKAKLYKPDFVVYTGDFVSTHDDKVQYEDLDIVLKSCVKGQLGTIGVLGNHDYGKDFAQKEDGDKITEMATKHGITILRNEQQDFSGINFIGLDDFWGPNFQPEKAMMNFNKLSTNVVLCHNPDVCDLDVWNNYEGWILSGHTHGGQVKPPFLDAPVVPVKNKNYTSGRFNLSNNRTLYINRALGHLWQIRFNVRPEITIFKLEMG